MWLTSNKQVMGIQHLTHYSANINCISKYLKYVTCFSNSQNMKYDITTSNKQCLKTVNCFNEHIKQLEFNQFISHVYVTE